MTPSTNPQQPEPVCPVCGGTQNYTKGDLGVCSAAWHIGIREGQQPELPAPARIMKTTLEMVLQNTDWQTVELTHDNVSLINKTLYAVGLSPVDRTPEPGLPQNTSVTPGQQPVDDELDTILMPFKLFTDPSNTLKPVNPEKAYTDFKAAITAYADRWADKWVEEAREEMLKVVAREEAWEQSRDHIAVKFGMPIKYDHAPGKCVCKGAIYDEIRKRRSIDG